MDIQTLRRDSHTGKSMTNLVKFSNQLARANIQNNDSRVSNTHKHFIVNNCKWESDVGALVSPFFSKRLSIESSNCVIIAAREDGVVCVGKLYIVSTVLMRLKLCLRAGLKVIPVDNTVVFSPE